MVRKEYYTSDNLVAVAAVLCGDLIIMNVLLYVMWTMFGVVSVVTAVPTFVALSVIYLMCTGRRGVVLYRRAVNNKRILMRVTQSFVVFAICGALLMWLGKYEILAPKYMLLYVVLLWGVVLLYRLSMRKLVVIYRSNEKHTQKVVFVGSTENIAVLYKELKGMPALGYMVVGYFDDEPSPDFPEGCVYLGKPSDVEAYLRQNRDIHGLYCCLPSRRADEIRKIIHYCQNNLVHFYSVPNVRNYLHNRMYFNMLGSVPYLSLYRDPLLETQNRIIKRAFDVVVSAVFLCTLFPFIFIIVAIITKITMPGPIFFRQKRNGINGKEFYCYKFRSMRVNSDADRVQATKNDPRKTKWGEIMRKTNIDELPQFFNVLKGDMSIVGPRPHMLMHTEEYSKLIDKYMMRHFLKPGITGWSQVTGFRGETKELSQMEGRVKGDIWYMEHWSFWLDIYIMYKTVANVIHGDKEAY